MAEALSASKASRSMHGLGGRRSIASSSRPMIASSDRQARPSSSKGSSRSGGGRRRRCARCRRLARRSGRSRRATRRGARAGRSWLTAGPLGRAPGGRPGGERTRAGAAGRGPDRRLGAASESSSTQVSLEPPPWEEFTTSAPSGRATLVSPPGSTQMSSPSLTAKGRRSMWRGTSVPSIRVGCVESATGTLGDAASGLALDLHAQRGRGSPRRPGVR